MLRHKYTKIKRHSFFPEKIPLINIVSFEYENVRTSLSIENIFDLHYKEFASGISAPGRSIILNLNVKF